VTIPFTLFMIYVGHSVSFGFGCDNMA